MSRFKTKQQQNQASVQYEEIILKGSDKQRAQRDIVCETTRI